MTAAAAVPVAAIPSAATAVTFAPLPTVADQRSIDPVFEALNKWTCRGINERDWHCYDNAAVETFFKTIKAELLWQRSWRTHRDSEITIFEYINGFYNPRRRHSALGWKSPLAFERKAA